MRVSIIALGRRSFLRNCGPGDESAALVKEPLYWSFSRRCMQGTLRFFGWVTRRPFSGHSDGNASSALPSTVSPEIVFTNRGYSRQPNQNDADADYALHLYIRLHYHDIFALSPCSLPSAPHKLLGPPQKRIGVEEKLPHPWCALLHMHLCTYISADRRHRSIQAAARLPESTSILSVRAIRRRPPHCCALPI